MLKMLCDDSEKRQKFSRERKWVIVKVKTTFEGTKTLLAASTGKKIQLERCHLLSTLFPSNTKKAKQGTKIKFVFSVKHNSKTKLTMKCYI